MTIVPSRAFRLYSMLDLVHHFSSQLRGQAGYSYHMYIT